MHFIQCSFGKVFIKQARSHSVNNTLGNEISKEIATIYVDQRVARECYMASLRMVQEPRMSRRRVEERNIVAMVDLDPRMNDEEIKTFILKLTRLKQLIKIEQDKKKTSN